MPREKMWVEYDDGTHLSQSHKKPGDYSPLTREDGTRRLGHVTLSPIDEDEADSPVNPPPVFVYVTDGYASDARAEEPSEAEDLIGVLILLGAIVALGKATPHVKRWLNDQARPAMKSMWKRFARIREADSQVASTESSPLMEPAPADASQEVVAALDAYRASMSSAEARERFVAALVARLFSEEQLRILRNARIEDEIGPLELNSATETLTAKQVGDRIKLLLEANPSLLDEETLVELGTILGRSRVDGEYVPWRSEQIKEATSNPRRGVAAATPARG